MKLLLDTCAFLWYIQGSDELPAQVRDLIQDRDNEVFLSPVSMWECLVKFDMGKLVLPDRPERYLRDQRIAHGLAEMPLSEQAVMNIMKLPRIHKDPFDRMLICQALSESATILTPDTLIQAYPVASRWEES